MGKERLVVKMGKLKLKNPIIPSAGCFGFGIEFQGIFDLNKLGALTIKAVTKEPKLGNKGTRIVETSCGVLNSIGLQNDGIEEVIEKIKNLGSEELPIIANISGDSIEDYVYLAQKFSALENIKILELNISCPNVKSGGMAFGSDPKVAAQITKSVKKVTDKLVFVKLTPNVTDIVGIAKAVEEAGADGLTMINTLKGIALNFEDGKPVFKNGGGGLSGPAIKPIALNMVFQVSQVVKIPIIGLGGVTSPRDVIDFISAGATAVGVGVANFANPLICVEIIDALESELDKLKVENISELRGRSWRE